MAEPFYPDDASVPAGLVTAEFVLEPLTVAHVELDYAALMGSKEMLHRWSATSWPADDFTLDANRVDLDRHDREHQHREAFTYTVLSPLREVCVGCVYMTPLSEFAVEDQDLAAVADVKAVVGFWIVEDRLVDGLDQRLLHALQGWFDESWAFEAVCFGTSDGNTQQVEMFLTQGLRRTGTVSALGRSGQFGLYRAGLAGPTT